MNVGDLVARRYKGSGAKIGLIQKVWYDRGARWLRVVGVDGRTGDWVASRCEVINASR